MRRYFLRISSCLSFYARRPTTTRTRRPTAIIAAPRYRRMLHPPASGRIGCDDDPARVAFEAVDDTARAVGVDIGWVVGGGGGSVGDGTGVGDGTVCRSGLCPGAAHRSGPAVNPTISIPNSTSQSIPLFIASSLPSEVKPELPVMIQHNPVDHPSPLHRRRLRRRVQ